MLLTCVMIHGAVAVESWWCLVRLQLAQPPHGAITICHEALNGGGALAAAIAAVVPHKHVHAKRMVDAAIVQCQQLVHTSVWIAHDQSGCLCASQAV